MGANGSHANGSIASEMGREWKTIGVVAGAQIIQRKNPKASNKLPEESHTPDRIYAVFERDGSDVKAIAQYDSEGKKLWEIHTTDHDSLGVHIHPWENGRPVQYKVGNKVRNVAYPLTDKQQELLEKIRKYGN